MITGLPSAKWVHGMLHNHLTNSSEFCVTAEQIDPVTNTTICRYGLPSIGRLDPGYTDQYYWRGRVWGPMMYIVWWGLSRAEYDTVDGIEEIRARYVEQAGDLLMLEWRPHRHVHENFNHMTGYGCTSVLSDPFYTWGGLLGLVGLLHQETQQQQQLLQSSSVGETMEPQLVQQ